MVIDITRNNFQAEVIESSKPVLVDFWAPWCGPCRMFAPIIHDVAEQEADKAKVVKINIDELPELAQEYGVMGVPTVLLFKNGKPVARTIGVQPKEKLLSMINA